MSVVLFSLCLILVLGFGFVQAGRVQAQEEAGVPLVKFEGVVTQIDTTADPDVWTIDEQPVAVTETTIVVETEGAAEVGAQVVVIAKKTGADSYEAIMIRVKPAQAARVVYLAGMVSGLTDDQFVVSGKTVKIDDGTMIEGTLADGVFVQVKARFNRSEYVALAIKVTETPMQRIVEFDGIVSKIGDEAWTIGDRQVQVNDQTVIQGTIVVGNRVKVRAYKVDDSLVALLIKKAGAAWWPKMQRFKGTIGAFPPDAPYIGTWEIGEREVAVTQFTRVRGTPVAGAMAHVTAWCFSASPQCVAMDVKIEGEEEQGFTIAGQIKELPASGLWGAWIITEDEVEVTALADRTVQVLEGTKIEGTPDVGDQVKIECVEREIEGVTVTVAKEVEVKEDEPPEAVRLSGKITEVDEDDIKVQAPMPLGIVKIEISEETVINGGPLAVDQCVQVVATRDGDEYKATAITVGDCPGAQAVGKIIRRARN